MFVKASFFTKYQPKKQNNTILTTYIDIFEKNLPAHLSAAQKKTIIQRYILKNQKIFSYLLERKDLMEASRGVMSDGPRPTSGPIKVLDQDALEQAAKFTQIFFQALAESKTIFRCR